MAWRPNAETTGPSTGGSIGPTAASPSPTRRSRRSGSGWRSVRRSRSGHDADGANSEAVQPAAIGTRAGTGQPRRSVPMMCAHWFGYLDTERILMKKLHTLAPLAAVAVALLALGGCATKGDIESLRSEIAGLRSSIESVDAKATRADANSQRAAADAAQAEAAANAASQKSDQIFRAGLRK